MFKFLNFNQKNSLKKLESILNVRKSRQQKDDKQGEREQNYESLENIISAAKQSISLFDKNSSDLSLTYAPAIASLKLNTKDYEECSKFILSRIKVIRDNLAVEINETDEEIKDFTDMVFDRD